MGAGVRQRRLDQRSANPAPARRRRNVGAEDVHDLFRSHCIDQDGFSLGQTRHEAVGSGFMCYIHCLIR
jgi:hypothetical protein